MINKYSHHIVLIFVFILAGCIDNLSTQDVSTKESNIQQHKPEIDNSQSEIKLLPPVSGVYHSAFPNLGGTEDKVSISRIRKFEKLANKSIVWVYFSNNWFKKIKFPKSHVRTIVRAGSIPFIRMMPRSSFDEGGDPIYTMQKFIDGVFDAALIQWAVDAKKANVPLIVEFGTEVNGDWFPWNGKWNGGGITTEYGDPNLPDGPERFRDAYKHIIDIFRSQNVQNITWVFHVNAESSPAEVWNSMAAYYPGDDYIDWIGVSVYGPQFAGDDWRSFTEILDTAYPELTAISLTKPIGLLEFGADEQDPQGRKAQWIREALQSIQSRRYPRLKAISYWHEKWRNDDRSISNLKIDSSPEALQAYKEEIADTFFITVPYFSGLTKSLAK